MDIVRDPLTSSEQRVVEDQSVELAVGDEREAFRRTAVHDRLQARPRFPRAHELAEQLRPLGADPAKPAGTPLRVRERPVTRATRVLATTMLYVGLAALVGLLAEWMDDPPAAVALIIVATFLGVLVAGESRKPQK